MATTKMTTVPTSVAPAVTTAPTVNVAPTRAQLLAYVALCQTTITAAEAVIASPSATRAQVSNARATVALYQAEIAETQAQLVPQAPRVVVVRAGDTLPLLAQWYYGDHTRTGFARIQQANGLTGPALQPGQTLTIPA